LLSTTLALAIGGATYGHGERIFSIAPSSDTAIALNEWSLQSDVQLLFDFAQVDPYRTRGVVGTCLPLAALAAMLRGTPLHYEVINSATVWVGIGIPYCEPWLGARAPLPPCNPGSPGFTGGTL
jgi:hypothetical protein